MNLTDRQRQIIDLMLLGCDSRVIRQRVGVTEVEREAEYSAIRAAHGVDTHSALIQRLRELRRSPDAMIQTARETPRQWWMV